MPSLPTSFEELQQRRYETQREELNRGFGRFVLIRSALGSLVYSAFWAAILFYRGAAYIRSQGPVYWVGVALFLLCMAIFSSALQYRQLKRSVERYSTCLKQTA